jgi:hypothetical protein
MPPAPPAPPSPPPLFSIVVVHYQGTVAHEIFLRGVGSLLGQRFKNFEILCYHDGPLLDPGLASPVPIRATETRFNDFGHSLRDIGIRAARGEYIVHFNADNVLYPEALEQIAAEIARPPRVAKPDGTPLDSNDIIIFPVKMFGLIRVWPHVAQYKGLADWFEILNGNPPVLQNIDCMQLVMKRRLWLDEGGWYDKSELSDGLMYQKFADKYGYRTVGGVLGEHH